MLVCLSSGCLGWKPCYWSWCDVIQDGVRLSEPGVNCCRRRGSVVARGGQQPARGEWWVRKAAEFSHLAKPLIIWADENICVHHPPFFWEPKNQGPSADWLTWLAGSCFRAMHLCFAWGCCLTNVLVSKVDTSKHVNISTRAIHQKRRL